MVKKIIKIVLIVLAVVLIVFGVIIGRKVSIIDKYCKKVDEYQKATNFYAKIEDDFGTRELWRKDDIGITKDSSDNNGMNMIYVKNDEMWSIMDMEYEGESTKIAYKSKNTEEDKSGFMPVIETGTFYVEDNLWEKIKTAFSIKISTENVNGKDCYKLNIRDDFQIYVNKTDFMKLKEINGDTTTQLIEYKFNSVEDSDVAMPNLEGYEIVEN